MDTNTPKNASADIDVIEKLWKKRFGIDATALDRALLCVLRSLRITITSITFLQYKQE